MGSLSEKGGGSRDSEIHALTTLFNGLNTALVGMETYFPPTAVDGSIDPSWVAKSGQTLSRAAYPALWERVKNMGTYVSDAAWLALQTASANGAVAVYSSGDGSTTFRMPTVGDDGGFVRAIGTDPVLNALRDLEQGFGENTPDHQHVTPIPVNTSRIFAPNANSSEENGRWGYVTLDSYDTSGALVYDDARASATNFPLTSTMYYADGENTPTGMYAKVYVFSGNSTTSIPTPSEDWLVQQDTNTQKIAEVENQALNGNDWVVIGEAGAPQFLNGFYSSSASEGLKYRFVDNKTIQVIGIARASSIDGEYGIFNFPSEIADRILGSQFAPAMVEYSSAQTGGHVYSCAMTDGLFKCQEATSSTSSGWFMINHTIVLDM